MTPNDNFYIGWQASAPATFHKPVRRFALSMLVLFPLLAGGLVWLQQGFSGAVFEYGTQTTLQGELVKGPVPFLRLTVQPTADSLRLYDRVLLIGLGKHGADSTIRSWQARQGSLAHKALTVKGTLIYHEGKAALELTDEADALLTVSKLPMTLSPSYTAALGPIQLTGEITDPKCFLGVMKPGEGRPHQSCAVRCIAGGIPPVLVVRDGKGQSQYYVVVGPNGEPVNSRILPWVGKTVKLRGQLEEVDNWLMLRADTLPEPVALRLDNAIAHCQANPQSL